MHNTPSPATITALRRAQRRLLETRARASNGRLTVANLAREAGVSRATVYRAQELVAAFRCSARLHRASRSPRYRSARDHIEALEAEIAVLKKVERQAISALRSQIDAMAQHIQALSLLTNEQRRRLAGYEEAPRSGILASRATTKRA
jgi:hypothetical protein